MMRSWTLSVIKPTGKVSFGQGQPKHSKNDEGGGKEDERCYS
jgi:hypothetical protein